MQKRQMYVVPKEEAMLLTRLGVAKFNFDDSLQTLLTVCALMGLDTSEALENGISIETYASYSPEDLIAIVKAITNNKKIERKLKKMSADEVDTVARHVINGFFFLSSMNRYFPESV